MVGDIQIITTIRAEGRAVSVSVQQWVGSYSWHEVDAFTVSSLESANEEVRKRYLRGDYREGGR